MSTLCIGPGNRIYIDEFDWDLVHRYNWRISRRTTAGTVRYYAVASTGTAASWLYMHTLIMKPGPGLEVDHRNNNGLDNRRANLRECTRSQNNGNQHSSIRNTSGYKGVSWSKKNNKWETYITLKYKRRNLGYFNDARDAALAYNRAAVEQWGEFAYLNKIPSHSFSRATRPQ